MSALSQEATGQLELILELLASDPAAPTTVTEVELARRVHVADSLAAIGLRQLHAARRIADVGSGAGFPGLALAACLPAAQVDLIEASARKCEFIRRAIDAAGLGNARAVAARTEEWALEAPPAGGREAYDVITARAVGSLATLAELASPLLVHGGALVAWRGARQPDQEAHADRAQSRTAMRSEDIVAVTPYPGSRNRHLHLLVKQGETPAGLPRRPGMAAKRPFGA
ncbi:MAG: class I SAM-dependent methyltransferase [Solirubrobacterales bacterium]|nr:class I SAM-dependent methyltransferase [Solirubrobacterales bacterium]